MSYNEDDDDTDEVDQPEPPEVLMARTNQRLSEPPQDPLQALVFSKDYLPDDRIFRDEPPSGPWPQQTPRSPRRQR